MPGSDSRQTVQYFLEMFQFFLRRASIDSLPNHQGFSIPWSFDFLVSWGVILGRTANGRTQEIPPGLDKCLGAWQLEWTWSSTCFVQQLNGSREGSLSYHAKIGQRLLSISTPKSTFYQSACVTTSSPTDTSYLRNGYSVLLPASIQWTTDVFDHMRQLNIKFSCLRIYAISGLQLRVKDISFHFLSYEYCTNPVRIQALFAQ